MEHKTARALPAQPDPRVGSGVQSRTWSPAEEICLLTFNTEPSPSTKWRANFQLLIVRHTNHMVLKRTCKPPCPPGSCSWSKIHISRTSMELPADVVVVVDLDHWVRLTCGCGHSRHGGTVTKPRIIIAQREKTCTDTARSARVIYSA